MTPGKGTRALWVFDFDGTLSPIVPERDAARLHPASRRLLLDLSAQPGQRVAVLSSRALSDLLPRVPVPRLFLGGGSGVEWRLPGGHRIGMGRGAAERAEAARSLLDPLLREFARVPGVEVEDKRWSVAVHHRKVAPEGRGALIPLLERLDALPEVRVFHGPSVAEVQLFPEVDKSFGVRRLCGILRTDPAGSRVVYAGDDENDAAAMRWVLARKGVAFAVGRRPGVSGSRVVGGPAALARAVRTLAGIGPPADAREGVGAR